MAGLGKIGFVGLFAALCSACGGDLDDAGPSTDDSQTALAACNASPLSIVEYGTEADLESMLIGRWGRCGSVQARGEELGVEFAADGVWYALTRDGARRQGIDYGGTWTYYPAGTVHPISREPSDYAFLELDSVITDPPTFTDDPRQMRILFTPVQSRYVPLDP